MHIFGFYVSSGTIVSEKVEKNMMSCLSRAGTALVPRLRDVFSQLRLKKCLLSVPTYTVNKEGREVALCITSTRRV